MSTTKPTGHGSSHVLGRSGSKLAQRPVQHCSLAVHSSPNGRHIGLRQLRHLPGQSQGWFSRWRSRSLLLTQRFTRWPKKHLPVSRSKGTWQMRTQSSSFASAREGIRAAMALPAKSFSALRRLIEPSARALASSSKVRLVVSWLTANAPFPRRAGH
jgi:hypothetical protein